MNPQLYIKSIGGLTATITIALAALILPIGLTGASAQTAPTLTVTIDSAKLNKDRTVNVVYTVSCSEPATVVDGFVAIQQTVGRFGTKGVIGQSSSAPNQPCDQAGTQITQTVIANVGFFTNGKATVYVAVRACNENVECSDSSTQQLVNLRR
jgi:hypothetical protein